MRASERAVSIPRRTLLASSGEGIICHLQSLSNAASSDASGVFASPWFSLETIRNLVEATSSIFEMRFANSFAEPSCKAESATTKSKGAPATAYPFIFLIASSTPVDRELRMSKSVSHFSNRLVCDLLDETMRARFCAMSMTFPLVSMNLRASSANLKFA